jgi:hypothetical protein
MEGEQLSKSGISKVVRDAVPSVKTNMYRLVKTTKRYKTGDKLVLSKKSIVSFSDTDVAATIAGMSFYDDGWQRNRDKSHPKFYLVKVDNVKVLYTHDQLTSIQNKDGQPYRKHRTLLEREFICTIETPTESEVIKEVFYED